MCWHTSACSGLDNSLLRQGTRRMSWRLCSRCALLLLTRTSNGATPGYTNARKNSLGGNCLGLANTSDCFSLACLYQRVHFQQDQEKGLQGKLSTYLHFFIPQIREFPEDFDSYQAKFFLIEMIEKWGHGTR